LGENLSSPVKYGIWIPALAGITPAKEMRGQDNWWGKPHPTKTSGAKNRTLHRNLKTRKSEALNPKFETISNVQNTNSQNENTSDTQV